MSTEEKITLPRVAKGPRPMMFEDEANDVLLSMNVSLLSELIVTRQRLDAVERLLDQKGILSQSDVNNFSPNEDAANQRDALREEISDRVFYLLLQQTERAERAVSDDAPGEDI
ncbi:MAG: hypothetical protein P8L66_00375 [Rhodospirillaceae bacterium]|nr:hypothetical protein [Rhodospirillaceae bacterium]